MRKLFMAVAILGISATVSFAKAQCVNENGNKEPFAVETRNVRRSDCRKLFMEI